jgi:hypothetical protein
MKPIPSKKSRRAEPLSTVNPRAAGIDVGAQFHVVAVPPECDAEAVRTFRSFTGDLHSLADWLVASSASAAKSLPRRGRPRDGRDAPGEQCRAQRMRRDSRVSGPT